MQQQPQPQSYDPSGVDADPVPLPEAQMPEALVALAIGDDDVFLGARYDDLLIAVNRSDAAVRVGPWGGTQASGSQAPMVVGANVVLLNAPLAVVPGANLASNAPEADAGTDAPLWALTAFNPDPGAASAIGVALYNAGGGAATWLTGEGAPRPSLWAFSNEAGGDTSFHGDAWVVTAERRIGVNWHDPDPDFRVDAQGSVNLWSNAAADDDFFALVATHRGSEGGGMPGTCVLALSNTGRPASAEGCLATLSITPDGVATLSNPVERDELRGVPTPLICLSTPTVVATFGADDALLTVTPTVYGDQLAALLQGGDLSVWDGNLLMQNGLPLLTSNGLLSNATVGSFSNAVTVKRGLFFEGAPLSEITAGVGVGVRLGAGAAPGSTTGPWCLSTVGWDLAFQNASNAACFSSDPPDTAVDLNSANGTAPQYATLLTIGADARLNGPGCNVTARCNLTVDSNLLVRGRAAVSNAVTLSSNLGVQCSLNVYGITSASNAAFHSSNLTVMGAVSIGPVACDNSYPLKVQTVNANNISIYAAGDIASFSDARFKADVRPIEGALDKVCSIGGYTYVRQGEGSNAASARRCAGVLAQEVERVLPEVVSADPAGSMHVSYGNMVPLLIEAIKELRILCRGSA